MIMTTILSHMSIGVDSCPPGKAMIKVKCTLLVMCSYKICTKGTKGTLGVNIISLISLVAGLLHYFLIDHVYK